MTAVTEIEDERLALKVLSLVVEPGDWRYLALARQLGGVGLLRALHEDPSRHELLEAVAVRLDALDVDAELRRAEHTGQRFVTPLDEEWPTQLDALEGQRDPLIDRGGVPLGLWVRGPGRLDRLADSVAVVGSRSSTTYGEELAGDIAAELGHAAVPVVSGAAVGIDYAAHRGAVSAPGGVTVAVLAGGADRPYPPAHRRMIEHLAAEHLVVSEAPPGAAHTRIRFLVRNRLIAALARGTVIVEAAARSGALCTVSWATRLNRVVMAVPGPVTMATSIGTHQAIRNGVATLVTCGRDVLELVGPAGEHLTVEPRGPENPRDALTPNQRRVLDGVPVAEGAGADSIAYATGLAIGSVQRALTHLESVGLAVREGRGWHLTDAARA
ncbi:DNA-processing protein DprA [Nocardioides panacisoli]|uniref:DNA-processing protein DprA n=1 Tax=Nocardioides panacisoli TaxID=627624 RepID=A0ABP7HZV8_9ACTN